MTILLFCPALPEPHRRHLAGKCRLLKLHLAEIGRACRFPLKTLFPLLKEIVNMNLIHNSHIVYEKY
jgi:hypothetical protein